MFVFASKISNIKKKSTMGKNNIVCFFEQSSLDFFSFEKEYSSSSISLLLLFLGKSFNI